MELKGCFLSLANAQRDEQTDCRFGLRFKLITKYLKSLQENLDFVILSEARICKNEDGTGYITPLQIALTLAQELNMHPIMQASHDERLSFNKIILFNPEKLFFLETSSVWPTLEGNISYVPAGMQFSQSITQVRFYLKTGKTSDDKGQYNNNLTRIFTLGAIHTPVLDKGRDMYFNMMINKYENAEPGIFIGDYNLLPDIRGPEHEELLNQHFTNCTTDIGTTFIGFPHDVNPEGNPWVSSLDRVYVNKAFVSSYGNDVQVHVENAIVDGIRVSDHFAMHVKINFSLKN